MSSIGLDANATPTRVPPDSGLALTGAVEGRIRRGADEADASAAFPAQAFDALREARLVSGVVPLELGGLGLSVGEAASITRRLARSCGSTAMIWAMHQAQVACVLAGDPGPDAIDVLRKVAAAQGLVSSVTSEERIGGEIRKSSAALTLPANGVQTVSKAAPTISYANHAGAFLITCRRGADSPADDQVAVIAPRAAVTLDQRGHWDPMGMRGTESPAFDLNATVRSGHVLGVPFAVIAARAMVPWSHTLWASCWYGLAQEAVDRARRMVKRKHKTDGDLRLGEAVRELSVVETLVHEAVRRCPEPGIDPPVADGAWFNDLKVTVSEVTIGIATRCLETCGMPGFQERSASSIARIPPRRALSSADDRQPPTAKDECALRADERKLSNGRHRYFTQADACRQVGRCCARGSLGVSEQRHPLAIALRHPLDGGHQEFGVRLLRA